MYFGAKFPKYALLVVSTSAINNIAFLFLGDVAPGADVGGSLLLSTLPQRIDALRSMVQEAQDICRARPVATAAAAVGTSAPPNRCVQRRDQSQQHQLQLFQTACDLDPRAQKDLLSALGSACVTKRQLLADLNEELVKLSEQNDQFTL